MGMLSELSSVRRIATVEQGENEEMNYAITMVGSASLSNLVVTAWVQDVSGEAWTEDTANLIPSNNPTAVGTVVTLGPVKNLERDRTYRVMIKFDQNGSTREPYLVVECRW